jgi:hypothetical protein
MHDMRVIAFELSVAYDRGIRKRVALTCDVAFAMTGAAR